jgi:hypothetical protein
VQSGARQGGLVCLTVDLLLFAPRLKCRTGDLLLLPACYILLLPLGGSSRQIRSALVIAPGGFRGTSRTSLLLRRRRVNWRPFGPIPPPLSVGRIMARVICSGRRRGH